MTRQGFLALWSHWRRNPWQLLTLLAGLALSTALWSGVQAINAEARASYASASDVLGAGDTNRILKQDGSSFTVEEYVTLRRLGWPVSPVLEGSVDIAGAELRIVGIDPLSFPVALPASISEDGGFPDMIGDDPVGFAHPDDMGLTLPGITLRVDENRPRGNILMDIAQADRLLGDQGEIRRLLVSNQRPWGLGALPDAYRIAEVSVQADVARLTQSFHLNLTAFGLLSFAVGIFIVYGAVGLAFEQRRAVFRTLRALGLPLRRLMLLLILELGVFALLAGGAGVALGYVIAAALLPDVAATLRGLYGAEVAGQLQLRAAWWLSGLAMALGGTAVAAAAALTKLAYMPLLSFNHPRAMSIGALAAGQWLALIAAGLFIAGVAIATFGQGLVAGFALLACLLIGSALFLPFLLAQCLSFAERHSKGALVQWFWADSRQQLPGLSMALMALLLAMAANIGVSTMVSSFRLTFVDYLDQRLASELYINASDTAEAGELVAYLEDKAEAVLPIVSIDTRLGGLPAEVFGIRDHATYRENWPLLSAQPEVWDLLAAGQGALVNEQLARRQDWQVGDTLPTGDRLIGIYSDYGNAVGQLVLGEDLFSMRYPDVPRLRFGVRTDTPEVLADDLRDRFGLGEDALINQADLKQFSMQVFERTFSVTAALNVLTLSVAGLAILISLLTLATMRLPQLAPVWALGLTRSALSRLEVVRAVCLATLTGVLALPVGLMLAWVLLAVVNVEAFGWRLPMYVFPLDYLRLGLLTVVAALLAALWPAIRLARTDPQSLLKVFSNER
ncbi:ABC transporter permease [Roseobacter denitrificans]|uniref:Permease, putative n=1 Tax=Roseobacter denitrificans (strain ATCC 33942 / OCh 114) TaxID=375451 RepID=Q167L2_ROSDO|nr:ABC transporter permease [Roseobacter denitrificans]ABG31831.1 permease, putative [Roseobacter denitrificans OCh 114]AVL51393.1 ABC transporter permease [Roseobacter denitrificans]SFF86392.1 putative ABC transport system permease protein [Roseobacter denitrificans OCh 114]